MRGRRGAKSKRASLDVDGRRREYLALLPSYAATADSRPRSHILVQSVECDMLPRSQDHTTSSADDTPSAMVVLPIAFKIESPIPKLDRLGLLGPIDNLQQP